MIMIPLTNFYVNMPFLLQFTDKDVYLSYLPLAHIFDRVMEEQIISVGASIGFWQGVGPNSKEVELLS